MPRCPCQNCGQQIEYPQELAGTTVDCPTCGSPTRLGSAGPATIKIPVFNPARPWAREQRPSQVTELAARITDNVEKVLVGKREAIQFALVALFSEGHVLLEDVPGVAKTMLARSLARSVDCLFKRIQCTPDLLPNDITGASIFNPKSTEFEFRPGPLFAQFLLADEINRATPRTQSALLEAMAEGQVTADGNVYPMATPFFLMATQNPIDHEGTFPLPEAQLDRFLMRLTLGYPQFPEELKLLERLQRNHPIDDLKPVATAAELLEVQAAVRRVTVDPKVLEYLLRIVQATREHDAIRLGASPRAAIALLRSAQAFAGIQGFDFVLPDDVKQLVPPILAHRLILRPESRLRKINVLEVLQGILNHVPCTQPRDSDARMKWLAGAIVVLIVAWHFELGLLVFAAYVVIGLVAAGRSLAAGWSRQLVAERTASETAREIGEKLQMSVILRNRGFLRIPWLVLEDSVPVAALNVQPPGLKIKGPWLSLAHLRGGESKTVQYEVEFRRRGYYQFGPLLAETGDLFGLQRTFRLLTDPQFILVYPKVLPLESYDIESPRPIGEIRMVHRLFEDPTRISGVRGFQHGDPINRIHWRATARTGVLQSKTFESTSVAGATILLDFSSSAFAAQAQFYASELAITAAATVARAILQIGQQVGLVSNGRDAVDRMKFQGWDLTFKTRDFARRGLAAQQDNRRLTPVVVETRRDAGQFQRILETLARLELTEEYAFHELIVEAGPRLPRSATVLAIVSRVSPEAAFALGSLRRRGYSVLALVVTFGEPEHPDWAAPPEWAEQLLQEGIPFHALSDEAAVSRFCAECLV